MNLTHYKFTTTIEIPYMIVAEAYRTRNKFSVTKLVRLWQPSLSLSDAVSVADKLLSELSEISARDYDIKLG